MQNRERRGTGKLNDNEGYEEDEREKETTGLHLLYINTILQDCAQDCSATSAKKISATSNKNHDKKSKLSHILC
jgi:hypothetical protein